MATQYTAGITQGQVWTAEIANQIGAAWETWTPVFTQSNTPAITINVARYGRIQKTVFGTAYITLAGAGTAANAWVLTLPITAQASNGVTVAYGWIYDANVTTFYNVTGYLLSATTMAFIDNNNTGGSFGQNPAVTAAASDQMRVAFMYEAA